MKVEDERIIDALHAFSQLPSNHQEQLADLRGETHILIHAGLTPDHILEILYKNHPEAKEALTALYTIPEKKQGRE